MEAGLGACVTSPLISMNFCQCVLCLFYASLVFLSLPLSLHSGVRAVTLA